MERATYYTVKGGTSWAKGVRCVVFFDILTPYRDGSGEIPRTKSPYKLRHIDQEHLDRMPPPLKSAVRDGDVGFAYFGVHWYPDEDPAQTQLPTRVATAAAYAMAEMEAKCRASYLDGSMRREA